MRSDGELLQLFCGLRLDLRGWLLLFGGDALRMSRGLRPHLWGWLLHAGGEFVQLRGGLSGALLWRRVLQWRGDLRWLPGGLQLRGRERMHRRLLYAPGMPVFLEELQ